MTLAHELAALFARDLGKLRQEIETFGEGLWTAPAGVTNSAGNLALHLEGNLREYVGRQLGGIAYERKRPLEFSTKDIPATELIVRLAALETTCLLYTSDAADERSSVDLGGRRIIK